MILCPTETLKGQCQTWKKILSNKLNKHRSACRTSKVNLLPWKIKRKQIFVFYPTKIPLLLLFAEVFFCCFAAAFVLKICLFVLRIAEEKNSCPVWHTRCEVDLKAQLFPGSVADELNDHGVSRTVILDIHGSTMLLTGTADRAPIWVKLAMEKGFSSSCESGLILLSFCEMQQNLWEKG